MRLIELVIVLVIVGIAAASFSLPLVTGMEFWDLIQFRHDVLGVTLTAMDRMVRDLTWIQDDGSFEAPAWNQMQLTTLADGWTEAVTYYYDQDIAGGGALKRVLRNNEVLLGTDAAAKPAIVVSSFSVTYFDMSNNVLAAPILPASTNPPLQVWRIRLGLTVGDGVRSVRVQEDVFPRSFNRALRGADEIAVP